MRGVDFFARQSFDTLSCLKAAGFDFVVRYYDHSNGTSNKCLSAAEVIDLHNAGLQIFPVFEWAINDPLNGGPQGVYCGTSTLRAARSAGQPKGTAIFFSVDFDASLAELQGPITEYFNGIYDTFAGEYTIGVYGSYNVCVYAQAHWPGVPHQWQTYAWSRGQQLGGIDLFQYENGDNICGIEVDLDESFIDGWKADMTKDEVVAIIKDYIANQYGPALEDELKVLSQNDVAAAVKAVATKLS